MVNRSPSSSSPRLFAVPGHGDEDADDVLPKAPDDTPPGPWTIATAYRYGEQMATSHYENFPVASRFVPASLRPHVWAIYAFARTADDFADEPRFEGRRRQALDTWQQYLDACYRRDIDHPVFLALRDTVRRHNIPIGPLQDLLTAFHMDLNKHRYASFTDLRGYCRHSAEPIGQLVLYVHGHRAPELHRFSNEICAALQMANFLQDLSIDIPRGRCYLPQEDLVHFGVTWDQLQSGRHTNEFKELMRFSVARVRTMFLRGQPLIRQVSPGLSLELEATWRSGMKILDVIEARDHEVLDYRPTLDKHSVLGIAGRSLVSFGRRFVRGEV